MNRYLFLAIFCALSAKTSAQAPPAFQELSEIDKANARKAFHTMGELPRLRRQPNKRWEMAIHWATHEGKMEEWMWEECFWDVDKDGNLFDKIKMKIWWKIDDYVYTALRILAKITAIAIAWPLVIKIYRAFRPKKIGFSAELSEDKQIVYLGESVTLTLSYDVGSEEEKYKLEPVDVGDNAHIHRIGSGNYLKGKGQVRYTYTPMKTEAWLPTFTIRDTKGRGGIGIKNNKYVGDLWYIEPSGGSISLQPTLSIKAVDWDLEQDNNASTQNRIVIDIKPTNNTVGREDRQVLARQDYQVRVKEVRGFNHTDRLRVSQNQGKITVDGIDKITVPLGACEDTQEVNPSIVLEVSHLDETKEVEVALSETYQRMVVNPEPRRTNPADFFNTTLERQRYDESRTKDKPLIYAAGKGFLKVMKLYKERIGEDINETDREGKSALYHAVKNNKVEVVDYVLSKGGSKVTVDDTLKSDIKEAIEADDVDKMSMYLKACEGVIDLVFGWRNSPLHLAAKNNSVGVARLLLNAGANKEAKDRFDINPLYHAVWCKHVEVANLLEADGAQKVAIDDTLKAHIKEAIKADDVEKFTMYLKACEGVISLVFQGRNSSLHLAAENNSVGVARLLLNAGANKEAKDRFDETPLHFAANSVGVARLLIEASANKEAKTIDNNTPLHFAANSVGVARLLIEAGANKEAKNRDNNTPLHDATSYNSVEVARLLIEAGANKEAKNRDDETPLYIAAYENSVEVARLLIEAGANKEAKNRDDWTPLYHAVRCKHVAVANLLVEAGAQKVAIDDTLKSDIKEAIEADDVEKVTMYLKACEGVIDLKFERRNSPLHLAAENNSVGVARLLIEAGANRYETNAWLQTPLSFAASSNRRRRNQEMIRLLQA